MSEEPIKTRCQNCSAPFLVRNIYEGDDGLLCEDCASKSEALRNEGRDSVILIRCTDCLTVPQQNKNASMESECGGCIAKERDQFRAEIGRLREALREERWQLSRVEAENAELHPMFKSLSANIEAACHGLGLDLAAIPGEGPMQAQNAVECITKEINQLRADLADARQKLAGAQADCAAKADALREINGLVVKLRPRIAELDLALIEALAQRDAANAELERLRAENKENFEAWQTALNLAARVGNDCESLRAQRDQAVLLARELGNLLVYASKSGDMGLPHNEITAALAKLQSLNPPPSDDTLKV